MNIKESLKELQSIKDKHSQELREATNQIQVNFESYISDTTIALKDRWNTFMYAPDELSNTIDVYPNLYYDEVSKGLDFFQDEMIPHIADSYMYELNLKESYPLHFDENGEISLDVVKIYLGTQTYEDNHLKQLLIDGAEDILAKNLMSFTCDS